MVSYTAFMADEEEFNAFDSLDCGGAVLMLGIVPAVMGYVFDDHNVLLAATLGGVAFLLAVAVYLLALLTRWRMISYIVGLVGGVLTPCYVAAAVYFWWAMAQGSPAGGM